MAIKKRTRPTDFGTSSGEAMRGHASSPGGPEYAEPEHLDLQTSLVEMTERSEVAETALPAPTARRQAEPQDVSAPDAYQPPSGWLVYLIAFAAAVLWALAPIAFALGYRSGVAPLRNDAFALTVFGLLAVGPAILVFAAAYVIRQGQKLGAEARRVKAMAEDMLAPAVVAAARAGDVAKLVREEIANASEAADEAREALLALRDTLALEGDKVVESTDNSIRTTRELTTTLGRERSEMAILAYSLDAQASRVTESIQQHARMVADATELAETQLRDAEAVLSARAADLASAAASASDAARVAGEDLTRHIARLEGAGAGVTDQVRAVESGLTEQRLALVNLVDNLKADHDAFAEQADAHAAKLSQFIGDARTSSLELAAEAIQGGENLRAFAADAAAQLRDLTEAARAEREDFGQASLQSLDAISKAAAVQRAELEAEAHAAVEALASAAVQTRAAAAEHASAAREQVEQMSEAAFEAGLKADRMFEVRLSEVRALVEQSAEMVDQAGASAARRLEQGAASARASLSALQEMMADVDDRAAQLPVAAQDQIDRVRAAVAEGLEDLSAQARRTAEEAQALDAGFQERARRNFEMLGEAVRLMGASVAPPQGATAVAAGVAASVASPAALPEIPSLASSRAGRARPAARSLHPQPSPIATPIEEDPLAVDDLMEPLASGGLADLGLRPRLKLTPTASDQEFSAVFEAAGGVLDEPADPLQEGESWTWKDLLASIDGVEEDGERLQDALSAELADMGIEPARLFPKARIDEIAAAVQTGDLDGARQVVRRLAPAAARRLTRRLLTDDGLRRQAQVYVRRYQTLIGDATVRDPEGFLTASLLGDPDGRLYLLLDAAAGDLTQT